MNVLDSTEPELTPNTAFLFYIPYFSPQSRHKIGKISEKFAFFLQFSQ